MRIGIFTWSKLPDAFANESAFCIPALPWEGTGTGSEDGRFASRKSGRWNEENKFEAGRYRHRRERGQQYDDS